MTKRDTANLDGSITIFLALSFTLIMSVIFSTLESARRIAVSSFLEGVTQISMDSTFSEFCKQLWEDYHIFATVTNNEEFLKDMESYVDGNIENNSFFKSFSDEITIIETTDLTSNNTEYFISQILNYMKYKEITSVADFLLVKSGIDYDPSSLSDLADGKMEKNDFDALDFGSLMDMVKDANSSFSDEDANNNLSLSDTFSIDILKAIMHIFDDSLAHYLVPSTLELSYYNIEKKGLPSEYLIGNIEFTKQEYSLFEKFLFCEYIGQHFGSYTTVIRDSPLEYQKEYIMYGLGSDDKNLTKAARELILLRFGFNVVHILTNKEKINTVSSVANTVSAIPALPIVIQILLISMWALSESIIDVKDLLAGKKVPFIKSADQWTLSLDSLLSFSYDTVSNNEGEEGLCYDNYLEILMMKRDIYEMSYRALDLIQIDYSSNINDTFTISSCFIGAKCKLDFFSNDIFSTVNFLRHGYYFPEFTITQTYYYH